jgi:hypothetical protein
VSSVFYLGVDAHVCRICGASFELLDARQDRRSGQERRGQQDESFGASDWRSGFDRRIAKAG